MTLSVREKRPWSMQPKAMTPRVGLISEPLLRIAFGMRCWLKLDACFLLKCLTNNVNQFLLSGTMHTIPIGIASILRFLTRFKPDEVQTGNGRTGKLYSYMNYGVKPDIFTTAKGLGGGLPIGATVFGVRAKDIYVPGTHGSTFGGNPTVCAGAINILSRIDDALMSEVTKKSDYIVSSLKGAPGVKGVTGKGLMLGIETEKDVKDVLTACRENGLIVLSAKNKVRLLPPLNIPFELVEKAVSILKTACV